jgi:MFS family permease
VKRFARLAPSSAFLHNLNYRRIVLAHAGSVVGDNLYGVALTWLTYSTLGAGVQGLAALGVALLVPNLALGVLTGTVVDRLDRRTVMVGADLARAIVMLGLVIALTVQAATLALLVSAALLLTTATLFFNPARHAILPAYVADDELASANAVLSTVTQIAALVTPGVGALLFATIGPPSLLMLNGLSFLWSALLLRGLEARPRLTTTAHRPVLKEAGDGLRFLAGHPPSRLVVIIAAGNQLFASGPWRVLVPAWVTAVLGGGVVEYGLLLSALTAGVLVANIALATIRARVSPVILIAIGVFVDGLTFLGFAFAPTLGIAMSCFFALGVSNGVLNTANLTRLQLSVPPAMRGRTFAAFTTTMNLTAPISLAATGLLAARLGPVSLIAAAGLGLMLIGSVGFVAAQRQLRAEASRPPA